MKRETTLLDTTRQLETALTLAAYQELIGIDHEQSLVDQLDDVAESLLTASTESIYYLDKTIAKGVIEGNVLEKHLGQLLRAAAQAASLSGLSLEKIARQSVDIQED